MREPVVEVQGLTKTFKKLKAVDDVSFEIYPGEILGLLGPNGAGKTTIIHMLLGLTTPDSGFIKIFGMDLQKEREKIMQEVNFSSTYVSMPNSLSVRECLQVFARLYKVNNREKEISRVLQEFEIEDIGNKLIRSLSSGQETRLNLAKAFINRPKVLFLDEPTASLDPDIADKTRTLLLRIKKEQGLSILYTSHNMKEMEELSDRILFLHKGSIITAGKPEEVIQELKGRDLEEAFIRAARERRV